MNVIYKDIEFQLNQGLKTKIVPFIGFKYSKFARSLNKDYFVYFENIIFKLAYRESSLAFHKKMA